MTQNADPRELIRELAEALRDLVQLNEEQSGAVAPEHQRWLSIPLECGDGLHDIRCPVVRAQNTLHRAEARQAGPASEPLPACPICDRLAAELAEAQRECAFHSAEGDRLERERDAAQAALAQAQRETREWAAEQVREKCAAIRAYTADGRFVVGRETLELFDEVAAEIARGPQPAERGEEE